MVCADSSPPHRALSHLRAFNAVSAVFTNEDFPNYYKQIKMNGCNSDWQFGCVVHDKHDH